MTTGGGMRPVTVHQARHGLIWGAVPVPDGSAGTGPAEAFTAPDPLTGEDRLHVVFGTGRSAACSLPSLRDGA